jgi:hypothetical protein
MPSYKADFNALKIAATYKYRFRAVVRGNTLTTDQTETLQLVQPTASDDCYHAYACCALKTRIITIKAQNDRFKKIATWFRIFVSIYSNRNFH